MSRLLLAALCLAPALSAQERGPLPRLLRELHNPSEEKRASAIKDLKSLGALAEEAAPALILATRDRKATVREEAVGALAAVAPGNRPAVRAIAAALQDRDRNVRRRALWSLRDMGAGAAAATRELVKILDGEEEDREDAIAALRAIGPGAKAAGPALVTLLRRRGGASRLEIIDALRHLGPAAERDAVPALVALLKERDGEVRKSAIEALGGIGPAARGAIPELVSLLGEGEAGSFEVRRALRKMGPDARSALPGLLKLLVGKDRATASKAASVLGELCGTVKETVPALRALLARGGEAQKRAVDALQGPEAHQAIPDLLPLLNKGDIDQRREVIDTIGTMRPLAGAATEALGKLLKDEDHRIRFAAAQALLRSDPTAPGLPKVLFEMVSREDYRPSITGVGNDGKPLPFREPLNMPPSRDVIVWAAGQALSGPEPLREFARGQLRLNAPIALDAVPILRKALGEGNERARGSALAALRQIGPMALEAAPELVALLNRADFKDHSAVIDFLGAIGGDDAHKALAGQLETPRRLQAARALGRIGGKSAEAAAAVWLSELGDAAPEKRRAANKELASLGGKAALSAERRWLKRLRKAPEKERPEALTAIGKLGAATPEGRAALLAALKVGTGEEKAAAAEALLALGKKAAEAAPLLVGYHLDGPEGARYATGHAKALGELGPAAKAAVPRLKELLWKGPDVRNAAARALAHIDPKCHPKLALLVAAGLENDRRLSREALKALAAMGPAAAPALPAIRRAYENHRAPGEITERWAITETLAAIGPAAVPELARLLDREYDMLVLTEIATALGAQGRHGRGAVEQLLRARLARDYGTRRDVRRALARLGPAAAEAVPTLLADLPHLNPMERAECALAILSISPGKSGKVSPQLAGDLKHPNPVVRLVAAKALCAGDAAARRQGAAIFTAEMNGKDRHARCAAILIAAIPPTTDGLRAELAKLRDDKSPVVRRLAEQALRVLDGAKRR